MIKACLYYVPLYCVTAYIHVLYSAIHLASMYIITFSKNLYSCISNGPLRITQYQVHCIPGKQKNHTLTFIMIIEEAKVMRTKIMALNQWCCMHIVIAPIHSTCIDCSWSDNARQLFIHFPQLSPVDS